MKKIRYKNDLGYDKMLVIEEPIEGKYPVTLFVATTGEYCSSGLMTKQELNDYFDHYHIDERL